MWCWRRTEKIRVTDRGGVLYRVTEERTVLHTEKKEEGEVDFSHLS
jgi:hypothetical protein